MIHISLCTINYAIVYTTNITNIFVQMVKQSKLQKIRIGILNILIDIKFFLRYFNWSIKEAIDNFFLIGFECFLYLYILVPAPF